MTPFRNQQFPVNFIQGPLAGISCAPFRRLIWRYSKPAFSYTEMISCKTLLYQSTAILQRYIHIDPEEGPVCFQLSANDPAELAEATKKATDLGASLIDLNCGCPVKKIRSKGAGSRLLTDPVKLYQLIVTMKQHTHVPISIKIRVDGHTSDQLNAIVAKVVREAGADYLVVHGRHWTQHYEIPCYYDEIKFFVDELAIPVIGNGDVACLNSLNKMLATGCAGVMISRAGVGQPWLIGKLMAQLNNETFTSPNLHERGDILIEHVETLATLLGSEQAAILQSRQFAKYYARAMLQQGDFCRAIYQCNTFADFKKICQHYFAACIS